MPSSGNPIPLDKVTVAVAGTPESLTKNYPTYGAAGLVHRTTDDLVVATLEIQALPENTKNLYFGFSDMNKATGKSVIHILVPGETYAFSPPGIGGDNIRPADYYLDVEVSGEGGIANCWQ